MNIACNVFINTFSAILLFVVYIYLKKYSDTSSSQNKLFIWLINITIMTLFIESLGRLDGSPGTVVEVINRVGNFLLFLVSPWVSSIWVMYIYHYLHQTEKPSRFLLTTVFFVNAINSVLVIVSQWIHWIYYIDSSNVYHRGDYYPISTAFTFVMLVIAALLVYKNRNKVESKHFWSLQLFCLPPLFCIILQIFVYGYSFTYTGVTLSLLILFLYVHIQDVFTDYLTGVANRKKLESYLNKKARESTPEHTFSAIMLDLDGFKIINDTFGHKTGDEVLQTTAKLIRRCLNKQDLIARYGGDEFCVVLDTSDEDELIKIAQKIEMCIEKYNSENQLPYKLGLSLGYAIYMFGMDIDDFENMIDQLMYEHKSKNDKFVKRKGIS